MNRVRTLLHPLVADLRPDVSGWASRSLTLSIRRTLLLVVALWQVVMILAAIGDLGAASLVLVVLQAALAGYGLLALRWLLPVWPVPVAMGALGAACYVASGDIDSLLVFAACWQINFATCAAGLLLLGRLVVPAVVVADLALGAVVVGMLPAWGVSTAVSIVATQISIIVALRLGLPSLLALARTADVEEAEAAEDVRRAEVAHRVSRQVAEEGRALHDTAINTLAAIATGGAATSDEAAVREQCARDVSVLQRLRGERVREHGIRLADMFGAPGLPVRRTGLGEHGIAQIEASLDPAVVRAIVGCVREAVTNAAKHSGAAHVEIESHVEGDRFMVAVRDRGAGFDGAVVPGRGLATSILARAEDAGATARVTSAPGSGTTVEISAPLHAAGTIGDVKDTVRVVAALQRRAGSLWGAGVAVVSVLLILAGAANQEAALFPMVGIMAASWLTLRLTRPAELPAWAIIALTAATCGVFLLSAIATAFGTEGALHWQALAATGPFVMLLSYRPPTARAVAAAGVWIVLIATIALATAQHSPQAAGIVSVAGIVGVGFCAVWWTFQRTVSQLGTQTAIAHRRRVAARTAAAAEAASQSTYLRWVDAGLEDAVRLLDAVATGARGPRAESTRAACAAEESYLRQLVLIAPELVHLGPELMPLPRAARDRDVRLTLRLGAQDAADRATARDIGTAIRTALDDTPAGGTLTASVFPVEGGVILTLAGPGIRARETARDVPSRDAVVPHHRSGAPGVLQLSFTEGGS